MNEFVSAHVTDGIGTLLLSRPPTNALTRQMFREIVTVAAELGTRDDAAAVIVFGGHEIFSGGGDVPELRTLDAEALVVAGRVGQLAIDAVAAIPKPTVAAVSGYALGSGMTLALATDWRIGGDNVKWGATQILDGLAPTAGDARRLADAVGESRARELAYSGRFVGADEALALGLVDELVAPDHVYDAAVTWAQRFVGSSGELLAAVKTAFVPARANPADVGR